MYESICSSLEVLEVLGKSVAMHDAKYVHYRHYNFHMLPVFDGSTSIVMKMTDKEKLLFTSTYIFPVISH